MLLLVLRSIAVYGGTAALFLFLAHRYVARLSARLAMVLALVPLLFTGRAMLTGGVYGPIDILYNAQPFGAHRLELGVLPDRSPVLSDVVYLEIPWRAAARRALFEGRLPLWNPSVLAGEPLLAVQQAAVLNPATWIGCLLPLPQAWTFEMTLRIFLALLCGALFFRELGCGTASALLGGLAWCFCDYIVFYLGCPQAAAAAPVPLLFLGFRRLAREPGLRAAAITAAAAWLIAASGHPETLLHASAGAGLYFAFELAGVPGGSRLRSVGLAGLAAAAGFGFSAVLLVPLLEALPQTAEYWDRVYWYAHHGRAIPPADSLHRLLPQLMPYAVGVSGRGRMLSGFLEPAAYAGALLFPLGIVGLFSRQRVRWLLLGLGLFGLAIWTKTPAADWLAKIPLFEIALNERLILLTAFALCGLAALGADRLSRGEGIPLFMAASAGVLAVLVLLFLRWQAPMTVLEMPVPYQRQRLLLQILPVAAAAASVLLLRRAAPGRAVISLVAILAAARTLEAGGTNPTLASRTFYPRFPILEKIPTGTPHRMAAIRREFIPNAAAVYGLEDVRGYEAMTLRSLPDTFPLWCIPQRVWFNRVDDPLAPFLSFLNVRWMLTPLDVPAPAGWPVLAESDGMRLIENPVALARVFVPRRVRAEPDPARRLALLASIRDFSEQGVVEEAGEAGEWTDNGIGSVRIAAYGAQRLELDVDAAADTVLATSIPAWRGWKATAEGRQLATVGYNHAFVGIRVPQGRHRVTLRYAPESVRIGILISAASLLIALAWLWRSGRSRPALERG